MKLTVALLVVLGLIAAFSAMFLVGSLRAGSSDPNKVSSSNIEAIFINESLPAMQVITLDHVTTKVVSKDELPKGYLASSPQAVGKLLAVPVVKGQVLTKTCFVPEGAGALLAAKIPHGMRAVSVTLTTDAITGGMLYPGCVVDVLTSFGLRSGNRNDNQALSTTLLHGIQVLAVGGTSVVSEDLTEGEDVVAKRNNNYKARLTVTLMVDPRQAEALQLATNYGSISMAMRNPLDKELVTADATVLSQGRMAKLGSLLAPVVLSDEQKKTLMLHARVSEEDTDIPAGADTSVSVDTIQGSSGLDALFGGNEAQAGSSSRWGVSVIRGREATVEELDMSD